MIFGIVTSPLHILLLEDSAVDAELIENALRQGGIEFIARRVTTEAGFSAALAEVNPQLVLCDYNVPGFRGDAALALAREQAPERPVIFVSGTIGEELAVDLLKAGATDYVLKDRLHRLPLAVQRALDEAGERAARRRAEDAARRSAETLSLALEASQMGTWDWDIATGELDWSDRCKAIYGIPASEPMNYGRFLRALHPDDRSATDAAITHALAAKAPHDLEYRAVWPDGSVHWVSAKGRAFYDEASGRPVRMAGSARDITARRQAEEERRRVETKLQETQKLESLGVLAGGLAHDFNNLLTGVLGNASLARMELSASSPLLPCIEQIEAAAMRAADLCKQMLAYAGKGRFVIQDVDLNALVKETTHLLQASIGKGVVLKFDFADRLPAVRADATQLRQIVMNLVINSSEAIAGRSGVVTIVTGLVQADRDYLDSALAVSDLPEGDYVFLEVTDTGSGMEPEIGARIFDPFFSTKFTGRGLGLAAVLGIVRSHGGTLKVDSEPGRGTTFRILLPAAGDPATLPAAPPAARDPWHGAGRVLVVDDEESVLVAIRRMLESIGFTVLTAGDGRKAVELFRTDQAAIRAVLLDFTMPHLDGKGTFRELRQIRPDVRVLLMSGFDEQEAVNSFVGKGLAGFLQKPFRVEDLRARMKEILE